MYQHALPFGSTAVEAALKKRQVLWNKLERFLRSLPTRSSIVVAGDLNSGLNPVASSVGFSVIRHSNVPEVVAERQMLTDMLRAEIVRSEHVGTPQANLHASFWQFSDRLCTCEGHISRRCSKAVLSMACSHCGLAQGWSHSFACLSAP